VSFAGFWGFFLICWDKNRESIFGDFFAQKAGALFKKKLREIFRKFFFIFFFLKKS